MQHHCIPTRVAPPAGIWAIHKPWAMPRDYLASDLKLLWGLAAARCAFPECARLLVAPSTDHDPTKPEGHISHIVGDSDDGPRADPAMPRDARRRYDNLILLCPNHHTRVDKQPNSYTVGDLRDWKRRHEQWVQERLQCEIVNVTFAELEIAVQAIANAPLPEDYDYSLTDPREKMRRNELSERIGFMLTMGLGKARDVEQFLQAFAGIDISFPDRLRAGFVGEYRRLLTEGFRGDALFEALRAFSMQTSDSFLLQAAGLAVLGYFFEKCDVFER